MRIAPLFVAAALVAITAPVTQGQSLKDLSVGVSVDTPTGYLDSLATTGFGLSVRTAFGDQAATWSGRGSFGFTYFSGEPGRAYANVQFLGLGADLVHRSNAWFYQYGGLTTLSSKYALRSQTSNVQRLMQTQDFGLTGGVGFNFQVSTAKMFVEVGGTTIFTGASNSTWYPFRVGGRF